MVLKWRDICNENIHVPAVSPMVGLKIEGSPKMEGHKWQGPLYLHTDISGLISIVIL